jgi:hypothetical protein
VNAEAFYILSIYYKRCYQILLNVMLHSALKAMTRKACRLRMPLALSRCRANSCAVHALCPAASGRDGVSACSTK